MPESTNPAQSSGEVVLPDFPAGAAGLASVTVMSNPRELASLAISSGWR